MLIDEKVINFNNLLTDAAFFSAKCREANTLLVMAQQQQQVVAPVVNQQ
jgi:hypothetical protein